ncbi:putative bifunctional chitinase/lysozyme [Sarcoptes scabiei]|uniref:Putative bifunctional chitinase/lysozyme n=1 Tax=Sarcoptes scabiei TaxID=52283 RepID=A0A834RB66_SARSC|nr:putative bifunctional chitinase/lysozyme [Sarcoptes scabiei]
MLEIVKFLLIFHCYIDLTIGQNREAIVAPYIDVTKLKSEFLANIIMKLASKVLQAPVKVDLMIKALKRLRAQLSNLTISFTMMVQGDDYGLTNILGTDILRECSRNALEIDIVNAMTMEFGTKEISWGDAVIGSAKSVHGQLKQIWPRKSDQQLYSMIGITPMIGRNFNGKVFTIDHANQLVRWASESKIGMLSFWSISRDNGRCPGGGISPDCSSISQKDIDNDEKMTTTVPTTTISNQTSPSISTTTKKSTKIICTEEDMFVSHPYDCNGYYWCYQNQPHLMKCPINTIWDQNIKACNHPWEAKRKDCTSLNNLQYDK